MQNVKFIIVTDKPKLFQASDDRLIVSPREFMGSAAAFTGFKKPPKIINLSSKYDYLSQGYYISLLAEARESLCIPDVANIIRLNWKRNYEFALPELNQLLEKHYNEGFAEPLERTYTSFFGRHDNSKIEPLTRRLFDLFRFPILSFKVKYVQGGRWVVDKIDTPAFSALVEEQAKQFHEALAKFTGSAWRSSTQGKKQERFWLAILHDPAEKNPPSNKAALKKFQDIGKKMNIWVELITKADFPTLLEYDALFIRETTAINNHTFRFASKAEHENIPCIDDTTSIIRCCNKVYLKELLEKHHIATPRTLILDKYGVEQIMADASFQFPVVLKVPDGAFSRGMYKASNKTELKEKSALLFKNSEVILAQEFVPSKYDWRIGVLNNKPLFASKYFMAEGHWQIYNHDAKKKHDQYGDDECVPIEDVPDAVMQTALKATKYVGKGLYGVDLKQLDDGRVLVIEVNDNPNIDSGVEDKLLGNELYRLILSRITEMIEE